MSLQNLDERKPNGCPNGFVTLQHQNFEESQEAMKQQLLQLSILLKALDPELCDFLGESRCFLLLKLKFMKRNLRSKWIK